ncbi:MULTISPECIES: hypothetical protein [Pseudonocardia]|uniref:Uncharacterized protein n=1 Tax=Pseudonocardia saturnea TaxID=33909 RepID=A0ABQ0S3L6_9PSEU|nr:MULTISPECIES: hypothetical protein [Pseudonocardia]BBG00300.1 hypothetical protein Pdca_15090 [Pseudonocardia autotrophica]GEC27509.1 hypothetical protein PSA01_45380 [Pseudonocardia saturnea]
MERSGPNSAAGYDIGRFVDPDGTDRFREALLSIVRSGAQVPVPQPGT